MTWGDLEDWILSQERSRDSKGSVFTGPIFQESDPVYEGVKVPVQFYKVVVVIDDAKVSRANRISDGPIECNAAATGGT